MPAIRSDPRSRRYREPGQAAQYEGVPKGEVIGRVESDVVELIEKPGDRNPRLGAGESRSRTEVFPVSESQMLFHVVSIQVDTVRFSELTFVTICRGEDEP